MFQRRGGLRLAQLKSETRPNGIRIGFAGYHEYLRGTVVVLSQNPG